MGRRGSFAAYLLRTFMLGCLGEHLITEILDAENLHRSAHLRILSRTSKALHAAVVSKCAPLKRQLAEMTVSYDAHKITVRHTVTKSVLSLPLETQAKMLKPLWTRDHAHKSNCGIALTEHGDVAICLTCEREHNMSEIVMNDHGDGAWELQTTDRYHDEYPITFGGSQLAWLWSRDPSHRPKSRLVSSKSRTVSTAAAARHARLRMTHFYRHR